MDADVPQRTGVGRLKSLLVGLLLGAVGSATAAVGTLDPGFGINGRVVAGQAVMPSAVLGLRDGRILLAMRPAPLFERLSFLRLQADGQPDRTFGNQGRLDVPAAEVPPFGALLPMIEVEDGVLAVISSPKLLLVNMGNLGAFRRTEVDVRDLCPSRFYSGHEVTDIVSLPDRRLLVVGSATSRSDFLGNPLNDACAFVVALRPDGSVDTSFGDGGRFVYFAPTFPRFTVSLAAYADHAGRVHLVGRQALSQDSRPRFFVARLLPDGRRDVSFGTNGIVDFELPWSPHCFLHVAGAGSRFFVAGQCQRGNDPYQLLVARFGADGTRDATFVPDYVAADLAGFSPSLLSLQVDGSLLFAGQTYPGWDLGLLRLTPQGELDRSLGPAGHAVYVGELPDSIWARPAIQPDGQVLFVARERVEMQAAPMDDGPIAVTRVKGLPPVVEFHNHLVDHYFYALDGEEARGIDQGAAGPGWSRTGKSFETGGSDALCRFYGTPGIGSNSHFFTAEPGECQLVKGDPGWTYEGTGFHVSRLHPQLGCTRGTREVFRLYNDRAAARDSNHRFVTDYSLVPVMLARGWVLEGPVFCVPAQ